MNEQEMKLMKIIKKMIGITEWDRSNADTDDRVALSIVRQVLKEQGKEKFVSAGTRMLREQMEEAKAFRELEEQNNVVE